MKAIGRNVTGVQGDAANLAVLDRLYETAARCKVSVGFSGRKNDLTPGFPQGVSWFFRPQK